MNTHSPGPDEAGVSGQERDANLVRGLISVAELMASTDDVATVYTALVTECVDRLEVDSAGLLMSAEDSRVPTTAIGASAASLMHLEHRSGDGPGVMAAATGHQVDAGAAEAGQRWPAWGAVAAAHGVQRVTAMPVRLVESSVGALVLLLHDDRSLSRTDCQVARTFAGLAAVVAHHDTELQRSSDQVRQLQHALDSRVVLEQAKGFLMAHGCESPEEAFEMMRLFSRRSGQRLHAVARDVVQGRLDPHRLCG